jgi:NADH dehydrogenase
VPVIVIVGGGFAGSAVARRLEKLLKQDEAEIVLLSRENFTLFTPMLPEASGGALELWHIVTPVRAELRRTKFVLADVTEIQPERSRLTFHHALTGLSETIDYDYLVLAIGSSTSTFGLPGVEEHAWAMKSLEDAAAVRNRLVWLLELADTLPQGDRRKGLLTVAIVGGGFTGVETAGEMAEFFHSVLRFYPNIHRDEIRIVLVEAAPTLLLGLPAKMGQYSRRILERRGIEVVTGDGVASVEDSSLNLQSGRRIETETVVWSAGVRPSPMIAECGLPADKRGAVITRGDMRVEKYPNVWALGDCAAIPDGEGGTYPMTAQHAIREGPHLADNIVAVLRGEPTKPFKYRSLGMMASLGARRAVAQLPGDRVLTGFPAWFLWRTYYLLRLPGWDRKVRVALDWTLDLIFPRDIAELTVRAQRAPAPPPGNE